MRAKADDGHTSVFLHPIKRISDESHVPVLTFCNVVCLIMTAAVADCDPEMFVDTELW